MNYNNHFDQTIDTFPFTKIDLQPAIIRRMPPDLVEAPLQELAPFLDALASLRLHVAHG